MLRQVPFASGETTAGALMVFLLPVVFAGIFVSPVHRGQERLLNVPTVLEHSFEQSLGTDPKLLGPVVDRLCNPVVRESSVELPVSLLLGGSCPPTVLGFVVPKHVYPVQRSSFRSLTHIFKKVRELLPPFAHFDVCVGRFLSLSTQKTPPSHGVPSQVGWGFAQTSVLCVLAHETVATLHHSDEGRG